MPFGKNLRTTELTPEQIVEIVRPAFSRLYDAIVEAQKSLGGARELLRFATAPMGPGDDDDRSPFQEQHDYVQAMSRIEVLDPVLRTAAAALLTSADALVAEREKNRGITDKAHVARDAAGPTIGNAKLGAVLRTSANNFRHYMEDGWAATPPTGQAKANIDILQAAGVTGPWSEIVAPKVFSLLQLGRYADFQEALLEVLRDV